MNTIVEHLYWYGFSCMWVLQLLTPDSELTSVSLFASIIVSFTSWGGVIAWLLSLLV